MKHFKWILPLVCGFLVLFASVIAMNVSFDGMTDGLMGNSEMVSIERIAFSSYNSTMLMVKNSGYTTSKINTASVNDVAALLDTCQAPVGIPKNTVVNYIVTLPNGTQFNPNTEYTFKLVTTKGTCTVYSDVVFDPATVTVGPSHVHSSNPIIAPSPKSFYDELPDYSLPFTIAFALILLVFLTVAIKYKSFRKYTLILTPIGVAELFLLVKAANYPYLILNSQFKLGQYGDFIFAISFVSIVGGIVIYMLNRIAHVLVERKIKFSLILLGYTMFSIGGIGLYLPWETGISIILRVVTFIFGVYLSVIGTANYFINKQKAEKSQKQTFVDNKIFG